MSTQPVTDPSLRLKTFLTGSSWSAAITSSSDDFFDAYSRAGEPPKQTRRRRRCRARAPSVWTSARPAWTVSAWNACSSGPQSGHRVRRVGKPSPLSSATSTTERCGRRRCSRSHCRIWSTSTVTLFLPRPLMHDHSTCHASKSSQLIGFIVLQPNHYITMATFDPEETWSWHPFLCILVIYHSDSVPSLTANQSHFASHNLRASLFKAPLNIVQVRGSLYFASAGCCHPSNCNSTGAINYEPSWQEHRADAPN